MQLLQEMLEENDLGKMKQQYLHYLKEYKKAKTSKTKMLKEGLISDHNGELERQFDEIVARLKAADRGLGLANKLPPEQRKANKSRVMKNMVHISKMLQAIMKQLGYDQEEYDVEFSKEPNSDRVEDMRARHGHAYKDRTVPDNEWRYVKPKSRF